MRLTRSIRFAAIVAAAALVLAACSSSKSSSTATSATTAATAGVVKDADTLHLAYLADMSVPDPDVFYDIEGNSVILSTLPTRTPASLTSDPSRRPLASPKRAFKCNFLRKGLMSPDAFRIRKMRTVIETSTSIPTRSWLSDTVFVVLGMAFI